jgi:hypothetical protein
MKALNLSLYEIAELMDHFSKAALVGRAEHEDIEQYKKFKYAAGRNFEACRSACKGFMKTVEKMKEPSPKMLEYVNRRDLLAIECAIKLPTGELDATDDGEHRTLKFTAEGEAARIKGEMALNEEYADVLAEFNTREERAIDFMKSTLVPVMIFTFPWDKVPEQMAGGYMAAIACMLDGIPEEFTQNVVDGEAQSLQE